MEQQNQNIQNNNDEIINEYQNELNINEKSEKISENENYILNKILENSSCLLSKEREYL